MLLLSYTFHVYVSLCALGLRANFCCEENPCVCYTGVSPMHLPPEATRSDRTALPGSGTPDVCTAKRQPDSTTLGTASPYLGNGG